MEKERPTLVFGAEDGGGDFDEAHAAFAQGHVLGLLLKLRQKSRDVGHGEAVLKESEHRLIIGRVADKSAFALNLFEF